jgi:hypothetical protein
MSVPMLMTLRTRPSSSRRPRGVVQCSGAVEAVDAVTTTIASTAELLQQAPYLFSSSSSAAAALDAATQTITTATATATMMPTTAPMHEARVIADVAVDAWSVSGGTTLGARFNG